MNDGPQHHSHVMMFNMIQGAAFDEAHNRDKAAKRQAEEKGVADFEAEQKVTHEYVSVRQMLDMAAEHDPSRADFGTLRAAAYSAFQQDLLAGYFEEEGGLSRVLLKYPGVSANARLRKEAIFDEEMPGSPEHAFQQAVTEAFYFDNSWICYADFQRWVRRRRYEYLLASVELPLSDATANVRSDAVANRRGAPAKADWDTICILLDEEVQRRNGPPERSNEKGWRTDQDAMDFLRPILTNRKEEVGNTTLRDRVRNMLEKYRK